MIVLRKFHVKKDERALLYDRGDFVEFLRPGEHLRFDPLRRLTIERFALANPRFEHRLADFLLKEEPELVAREFHVIELGPAEEPLPPPLRGIMRPGAEACRKSFSSR